MAVPLADTDLAYTVEGWWAQHWANPEADDYVAPEEVTTHPGVVSVPVGGNLQTYVDAAPNNTTFSLAAGGTYGRVTLVERSGLHFVSANPASPAVCRGFDVYGSTHAQQYNTAGASYGFVGKLFSGADASLTAGGVRSIRAVARRRFLRKPSRDLIFKDLAFVSDGSLVYYQQYSIGGTWITDHWYANAPIGMRCVQDVLVQGCSFAGYKWGTDNSSAAPNDPQENILGPVGHPGLIWGNAGIRNVVIRGCTFALATNADNRGFPYVIFFDGAQGVVAYGNTISGKQHSGSFLFLTNDDYTYDIRNPGTLGEADKRQARQVALIENAVSGNVGTPNFVNYAGGQLLCKGNSVNQGAGTVPVFAYVGTKVCGLAASRACFYRATDHVFDDNTITGNCTAFVELQPDTGYVPGLTTTHPFRSLTGNVNVKNNAVSGTIGGWLTTKAGALSEAVASPTPSGNNKNDGGGVGI